MNPNVRIFIINSIHIQVDFTPKLVGIHNNDSFDDMMNRFPQSGIHQLAQTILSDYQNVFGQELKVSVKSLEIEIWGHYYFEKLIIYTKQIFVKMRMMSVKKRLMRATKIFDCGEASIDKNRWIWDGICWAYPIIKFFIRDKPNNK